MRPRQRHDSPALPHASSVELVDIHCHCLPGVDDGPQTLDHALALCRALVADGVGIVVATPHQLGRYDVDGHLQSIHRAYDLLIQAVKQARLPLTVRLGGEIRIDERIPSLLSRGGVLFMGKNNPSACGPMRYAMVELPDLGSPDPCPLIAELKELAIGVIIPHPERMRQVIARREVVKAWVEQGAFLQVTAASLIGDCGASLQRTAWELLEDGLVQYVASDAHDARRRPPLLGSAYRMICQRLGEMTALQVCVHNPLRLLSNGVKTRGWRTEPEVNESTQSAVISPKVSMLGGFKL